MKNSGKMLLLKFCRALTFLFLFRYATPAGAGAGAGAEQTDLDRDAEALLEMKESFVGSGGSLQSWTNSPSPCNWTGINCSVSRIFESSHGSGSSLRVTELALKNVSLPGSFSPAIGRLSALTSLDLSSTGLTGSIPKEVWNLTRLTVLRLKKNGLSGNLPPDALERFSELQILDLSDNLLTGGIPDVCHLQNLTYLSLAGNSFDGWLPEDMFTCMPRISYMDFAGNNLNGSIPRSFPSNVRPNLVYLNVSHNRLEGEIPRDLAALPFQKLDLSWNLLSGTIPEETGQLAQLDVLILAHNKLTGRIPEQLGNCTRLGHLDLAHNNLSGKIPGNIGNLRRLTFLNLGTNGLSGQIPGNLSNLNSLVTLMMRGNELSGEIPNFLGELSNLEMLDLGMNLLWGKIPRVWRGTQSKLQSILFDGNAVNGKIPPELGLITGLKVLNLSDNALRGRIPPGLGAAANLTSLLLGGNKLSGTIPRELGKLVHLEELNLSSNFITGSIPSAFSNFSRVSHMDLGKNKLSDSIPVTFKRLENLQYLELEENNLTGDIPEELCSCVRLKYLSLPRNQLSGQIPRGLGKLSELQTILDLSSNNLSGTIPLELHQLTKLEALNLSRNSLTGGVSGFLSGIDESFSLRQLDLSFNNLEGEIPPTDFTRRLNASSFYNNSGLCGSPLNVSCPKHILPDSAQQPAEGPLLPAGGPLMPVAGLPSPPDSSKQSAGVSKTAILGFGIAVASLTVALLLLVGGMRTFIQYCKRGPSKHEVGGRGTAKSVFHGFTFSGILWERDLTFSDIMEATDDLSPDRQVGSGSFGPVYKAVMPDGEILAVKALKLEHEAPVMPHDKKTITAIVNLCKVRHRHLLRLLGFCAHKGRSLLIYEYMQNGSLWDHLHGACVKLSVSGHQTFWSSPEPDSSILDWPHRYDIALGTAKALAYLHHDCVPRILHGDIKSTNILLDTHMIPYVGDFGLVELLPAGSSDSQAASSILPGSRGYTAPEYEYTGTLSEEGDVYSFGVVLLEMITGRTAADCGFPDGIPTLVGWLRYCRACRLSIEMVFDNRLQILISDLERYEMLLVLKVAYICTNDMPCKRPSMRNVLNLLKEVKRQSMTAGECFSLFATKSLADILPPGGVGEFESR